MDALILAQAKVDTGDTAWMLTATALVLFMTVGLGSSMRASCAQRTLSTRS
jgi:ammonia channel protein AmtB